MAGDWADGRARDWLEHHMTGDDEGDYASLASLLREVAQRAADEERKLGLAEVRRVVEQTASDVRLACISTSESDVVGALRGALLCRLDKL